MIPYPNEPLLSSSYFPSLQCSPQRGTLSFLKHLSLSASVRLTLPVMSQSTVCSFSGSCVSSPYSSQHEMSISWRSILDFFFSTWEISFKPMVLNMYQLLNPNLTSKIQTSQSLGSKLKHCQRAGWPSLAFFFLTSTSL